MKSFIEQAQIYATYHQKEVTRYTHLVGVPLILFSLMVLFGFVHLVITDVMDVSIAFVLTIALIVYYFILNWRLALPLTAVLLILLWLASLVTAHGPTGTALWIFVFTFVIGWAFQLAGHFIEGRRPALMDNFWQALIAPLFLTAELFFLAGYFTDLKVQIKGIEQQEDINLNS